MTELRLTSFPGYIDYLSQNHAREIMHLIDGITINKTDFFREKEHFHFLAQTAVPHLISQSGAGVKREFFVWSAGCSTGEEPYTIGMVLNGMQIHAPGIPFQFTILGTDISNKALEVARLAVYPKEKMNQIPIEFQQRNLMVHQDKKYLLFKVIPELRNKVKFRRLNLLEAGNRFREPMDVVFCRNVIIYFAPPNQEKVLRIFVDSLRPGGYLFIGHSESLQGFDLPVRQIQPTIYKKVT
ncbi:MAG: protein-glutamate O-methyltransferase CheR [bacterium]|nr:protein-glutamate O-methyltransferase CheR [bacterium]